MKNWIIFFSFLIPTISFASINAHSELWVSDKHAAKVEFKFYKNKIKAKHLTTRGWNTFREISPGVYDNYRGSKLIVEAPGIIVYTSRNRRKNIVFRPATIRIDRDRCTPSAPSRSILGGTWKIKDLNKKLYITDIQDGFEARLSGQTNWTRYQQKDSGFFVDKHGNSYTVKSNNELFWESKDGRQVFVIYR